MTYPFFCNVVHMCIACVVWHAWEIPSQLAQTGACCNCGGLSTHAHMWTSLGWLLIALVGVAAVLFVVVVELQVHWHAFDTATKDTHKIFFDPLLGPPFCNALPVDQARISFWHLSVWQRCSFHGKFHAYSALVAWNLVIWHYTLPAHLLECLRLCGNEQALHLIL